MEAEFNTAVVKSLAYWDLCVYVCVCVCESVSSISSQQLQYNFRILIWIKYLWLGIAYHESSVFTTALTPSLSTVRMGSMSLHRCTVMVCNVLPPRAFLVIRSVTQAMMSVHLMWCHNYNMIHIGIFTGKIEQNPQTSCQFFPHPQGRVINSSLRESKLQLLRTLALKGINKIIFS